MKICNNVHQICMDFLVTEQVKRYVYMYLITGRDCYLIDSGVAGSEKIIEKYMEALGRNIREIKAVFLTHAHPDHMGGAAALQKISGCQIYASEKEKSWIEDIDLQFRERPIPNFYTLVPEPVRVDGIVKEGDVILPEEKISVQILETAGHSAGHVSYIFEEENVLFSGDAIPDTKDFLIFTNEGKSEESLEKMAALNGIQYCCPAWDRVYNGEEWKKVLRQSKNYLQKLKENVLRMDKKYGMIPFEEQVRILSEQMGWEDSVVNPLVLRSIEACRY